MYPATRTLTHCLSEHVNWHIARVQCVSLFILSMFACESVSLSKISDRFGTRAKRDSHFKRLQRLLRFQVFDYHRIAKLVLEISGADITSCTVAVDRTNWKFGSLNINILVIGVVHGSLCIPVVFSLLPKQGNSNHKERKALLKQFLTIIPATNITLLLADREFIGESWFKHLQKEKIPYVIRVKENFIATLPKKGTIQLSKRFAGLRKGKRAMLRDIGLCGVSAHLAATRLKSGELLLVVFHRIPDDACPLFAYKRRWAIETLFRCLKSKGFNLEDTQLKHLARIKKLFAICAIAAAWAVRVGEIKHGMTNIRMKNNRSPEYTRFVYGKIALINLLFGEHNIMKTIILFCFKRRTNLPDEAKSVL